MFSNKTITKGIILIGCSLGISCSFAIISLAEYIPIDNGFASMGIESWNISNVAKLLVASVVAIFAPAIEEYHQRSVHKSTLSALFVFCIAIASLDLIDRFTRSIAIFSIFIIVGFGILASTAWLIRLSKFTSKYACIVIIFSMLINLPVPFLFSNFPSIPILTFSILGGISCFAFMATEKNGALERKGRLEQERTPFSATISCGIIFLVIAGRLVSECILPKNDTAATIVVPVIGAAIIAWVLLVKANPPDYTTALRLTATLLIVAYLAYAIPWPFASSIPTILAVTAGWLLWYGVLIVAVDIAGYTKSSRLRVVAIAFVFQSAGGVVDIACLIHPNIISIISPASMGGAIVLLLVVSTLWLLNDRRLTAFFRGQNNSKSAENDADRLEVVKRAFKLTPKETEICSLLLEGRSIPFIAETLVVSNNTVKSHVAHMYTKVGVHSRQEFISAVSAPNLKD